MIVKILDSSKSFNAINYNASRVNKGEAVLLNVRNMGAYGNICQNIWDYKKFLEKWTNRNSHIKNGQFHVTISCKGKDASPEQLQSIAEKWLNLMGYSENPTLFFFHKNTRNNHLHIVTTRIDKNGKKINDSFEKERSLKAIKSIMGNDIQREYRDVIAKSLRYSYSSIKQFSMILEDIGFKVMVENDGLNIEKNGINTFISNELIDYCQNKYYTAISPNQKLKNRAIFDKYSKRLGRNEFKAFMKANFGLSVLFFGKQDSPYGYAVIDHKNHVVIPGRDIIPIKKLFTNLMAERVNIKDVDFYLDIINMKLQENKYLSEYQINRYLSKYNVLVKNGLLIDKLLMKEICVVRSEEAAILKRNNILFFIRNTYNPQTSMEYQFICQKYRVDENDLKAVQSPRADKRKEDYVNQYRSILLELSMSEDIMGSLREMNLHIIKGDTEFLLYDNDNGILLSNISLDIDYNIFNNIESNREDIIDNIQKDEFYELQDGLNELVDFLESITTPAAISTSEGSSSKKRKKR